MWFLKPKRTAHSVARQILDGLRDGTIVLEKHAMADDFARAYHELMFHVIPKGNETTIDDLVRLAHAQLDLIEEGHNEDAEYYGQDGGAVLELRRWLRKWGEATRIGP